MSKRAFLPLKIAPLQRVRAEPITDPTEQAALDKVRRKLMSRARSKRSGRKGSKAG